MGQQAGFDEYVVVRTPPAARRFRDYVVPGTTLVGGAALGRIFAGWQINRGPESFSGPTLVVAGRHDSIAGYTDAVGLLPLYPGASLAVNENASHAVIHEQPDLPAELVSDWLDRTPKARAAA